MLKDIKKFKLRKIYDNYCLINSFIVLLLVFFLYGKFKNFSLGFMSIIFLIIEIFIILSIISNFFLNKAIKRFYASNKNYKEKMEILSSYSNKDNVFVLNNIYISSLMKILIFNYFIFFKINISLLLLIIFMFVCYKIVLNIKNYKFDMYKELSLKYGDNFYNNNIIKNRKNSFGSDLISSKIFKSSFNPKSKSYVYRHHGIYDQNCYLNSFEINFENGKIIRDAYVKESFLRYDYYRGVSNKGVYIVNSLVYLYKGDYNFEFSLYTKEIVRNNKLKYNEENDLFFINGSYIIDINLKDKIKKMFDRYLLDIIVEKDCIYFVKYISSYSFCEEELNNFILNINEFDEIAMQLGWSSD